MKTTLKLLIYGLLLSAIVVASCSKDGETGPIGAQGPQGEQGTNGEDGNANVQTFDFIVSKADWSSNGSYGANMVFRSYEIPADSTGGVTVNEFYYPGNAVLAYARLLLVDANYQVEGNVKQLPMLTTVDINGSSNMEIGLRLQLSLRRSEFQLGRTTNGWDSKSVSDEQVPQAVEFRLVFIKSSVNLGSNPDGDALAGLKTAGVDIGNYEAVMDYFGLKVH